MHQPASAARGARSPECRPTFALRGADTAACATADNPRGPAACLEPVYRDIQCAIIEMVGSSVDINRSHDSSLVD